MDILLIFLLIFSFTPVLLWGGDNWKKTAIGQIPFVIGAWIVFYQYITVGIGSGQMYLWGIFIANLIYGHIAFTIILLEMRKSMKSHSPLVQQNN